MTLRYFKNGRGVTLSPVYPDAWDNSGNLPRFSSPFVTNSYYGNTDAVIYCGATKTATWTHFDKDVIEQQVSYLRSVGVNLVRLYLDMYSWCQLTPTVFTSRLTDVMDVLEKYKVYSQLVLFDGYTEDDFASDSHALGGLDPSSVNEGVAYGLKRWQRCPTISTSSYTGRDLVFKDTIGRDLATMTASGDAYIASVVSSVFNFKNVLAYEVFADINILDTELEGYDFIVSAINKVNSLKKSTQNTTVSIRNLNSSSTTVISDTYADIYVSSFNTSVTPLVDHVCYIEDSPTYAGRIHNFIAAKHFSDTESKPIFCIKSSDFTLDEDKDFIHFCKKFDIGFTVEGLVDRNFSHKPNNKHSGIFYDDGEVREIGPITEFVEKALQDGFLKNKVLTRFKTDKTSFEKTNATTPTAYSNLSEFGDVLWSRITTARTTFSEYSGVTIGHTVHPSSVGNINAGWTEKDYSYNYGVSSMSSTIASLRSNFSSITLSSLSDEVVRDKLCYQRVKTLIALTEGLKLPIFHNHYNSVNYGEGYVTSSTQVNINTIASGFMPASAPGVTVVTKAPYIGTPRFFSGTANLSSSYYDSVVDCQKPICYYTRSEKSASGGCILSSELDGPITQFNDGSDNFLNYIDWAAYDILFIDWLEYLEDAYTEFNESVAPILTSLNISYF